MVFLISLLVIPALSQEAAADMGDMGLESIGPDTSLFKTMMDITQTMNQEKEEKEAADQAHFEAQEEVNEKVHEAEDKAVKANMKAAKNKWLVIGAMIGIPMVVGAALVAGQHAPEDPVQRTMRKTMVFTAGAVPVALLLHTAASAWKNSHVEPADVWSWNPVENHRLGLGLLAGVVYQVRSTISENQKHQETLKMLETTDQVAIQAHKMNSKFAETVGEVHDKGLQALTEQNIMASKQIEGLNNMMRKAVTEGKNAEIQRVLDHKEQIEAVYKQQQVEAKKFYDNKLQTLTNHKNEMLQYERKLANIKLESQRELNQEQLKSLTALNDLELKSALKDAHHKTETQSILNKAHLEQEVQRRREQARLHQCKEQAQKKIHEAELDLQAAQHNLDMAENTSSGFATIVQEAGSCFREGMQQLGENAGHVADVSNNLINNVADVGNHLIIGGAGVAAVGAVAGAAANIAAAQAGAAVATSALGVLGSMVSTAAVVTGVTGVASTVAGMAPWLGLGLAFR